MTQPLPIWREDTRVRPFETDFRNCWKPACFFQTMQETATHHAHNLGYAYHDLLVKGMVWVLTRMKIIFHQFPLAEQKIIVETWPKGIQQKIFFTRDFRFSAPTGEVFAVATSGWLLIDPQKRRMLLPNVLPGSLPRNEGHSALDELLDKIPPADGEGIQHTVTAGYSAIDLMGHVNNARYVEWICDTFSQEHHHNHRLGWMQINYNNEVKPGETVTLKAVQRIQDSTRWVVESINAQSGARAFNAELGWVTAR